MSAISKHLRNLADSLQPWIDDGEFTEFGMSVENMKDQQSDYIKAAENIEQLERALATARADALEAAAKVCEERAQKHDAARSLNEMMFLVRARQLEAEDCAAAIRARKEKA